MRIQGPLKYVSDCLMDKDHDFERGDPDPILGVPTINTTHFKDSNSDLVTKIIGSATLRSTRMRMKTCAVWSAKISFWKVLSQTMSFYISVTESQNPET